MAFQTAFKSSVDIGNRALQHVGQFQIQTLYDDSRAAKEVLLCYDKLRQAELRKIPWRCATRRAFLYPWTSSTVQIVPQAWAVSTTYGDGQLVFDAGQTITVAGNSVLTGLGPNSEPGTLWIAIHAHTSNAANAPGNSVVANGAANLVPTPWQQYFGPQFADIYSATVTYNSGDLVYTGTYGSTLTFYICLGNAVINMAPASGNPWYQLNISSGLGTGYVETCYPWAVGPSLSVAGALRTIFPLPTGYLRLTGPDRTAATANLTASGGIKFNDWQLENDYMLSAQTTPQLMRFVADLSDVSQMDTLFCELLAARIGMAVAPALTQDAALLGSVKQTYQELFTIATLVNNLEIGSTESQQSATMDRWNDQSRLNPPRK
jgi:hypothetical protein